MAIEKSCGNRSPISGECVLGCGGFGGCQRGYEDHIKPRSDKFNPLTGNLYPDATQMSKLTPDSFKLTLLEEAHRLRRTALAHSITNKLDARTSMWVIREDAWRDFERSTDFLTVARFKGQHRGRNELLGLPVRITFEDDPDVPMIQLVMEPETKPRFSPPLRKAK